MTTSQFEVEFTKDGSVHDQNQVTALLAGLAGATDLLVLSHGWNNDMREARDLYDAFMSSLGQLPGVPSELVVMRVFWPSKKFADEDFIPGGGAASADTENETALLDALNGLKRDPDRLGEDGSNAIRTANIDGAIAVIDELEFSEAARREFVLRIRAVLNPDEAHIDDASVEFFSLEPEALFDRFSGEVPVELQVGVGGIADVSEGGAAFFGDLLSGIKAAARRIANFATYYQMKSRAGTVGRGGVAATLNLARERNGTLRIHLAGHSFGGRLVTAAANSLHPGGAPVTMSLLQAAFSHNGLAQRFDGDQNGAYRSIIDLKRISGPIVITHTKNDKAVGIAYPLASRIAFDNSAALGDANDPYGGMGRNGAQHTPEVEGAEAELRKVVGDGHYAFVAGSVYNLNADAIITDHGDVASVPVANAVLNAIRVSAAGQ